MDIDYFKAVFDDIELAVENIESIGMKVSTIQVSSVLFKDEIFEEYSDKHRNCWEKNVDEGADVEIEPGLKYCDHEFCFELPEFRNNERHDYTPYWKVLINGKWYSLTDNYMLKHFKIHVVPGKEANRSYKKLKEL